MKKIIITGKSNIEAVKGIKRKKRATMKDISDINVFDIKQQIESIKKLYGSCDFKYKNLYSREIKKKLAGYALISSSMKKDKNNIQSISSKKINYQFI